MQKYSFANFRVFYYDSLKNTVVILGKPMDGFVPLDSSTHLVKLQSKKSSSALLPGFAGDREQTQ